MHRPVVLLSLIVLSFINAATISATLFVQKDEDNETRGLRSSYVTVVNNSSLSPTTASSTVEMRHLTESKLVQNLLHGLHF